jgi:hypothetical protein
MAEPFGGSVGQIILQAAQGIVAQKQKQQQLQLQTLQFEEQVKQQEKVLDLRQQEMEVRQRTVKVQEEQLERAQGFEPLKRAQSAAELLKTQADIGLVEARTAAAMRPGGRKLTDNQRFDAIEDIEQRSVRLEMSQVALKHEELGGSAVPRLGSPEEYIKERRRLQGLVNKFQTSSAGTEIAAQRALTGKQGDFEIDKISRQLAALDAFISSDDFTTTRDKLDERGADPRTRQAIIENFYAPFKDQLSPNASPGRVKAFDFGTVPSDQVENAWALFEDGNVEVLMEKTLLATGGAWTAADKKAFDAELLRRFPTPGEEQDDAVANYRRLLDRISAQKITE